MTNGPPPVHPSVLQVPSIFQKAPIRQAGVCWRIGCGHFMQPDPSGGPILLHQGSSACAASQRHPCAFSCWHSCSQWFATSSLNNSFLKTQSPAYIWEYQSAHLLSLHPPPPLMGCTPLAPCQCQMLENEGHRCATRWVIRNLPWALGDVSRIICDEEHPPTFTFRSMNDCM